MIFNLLGTILNCTTSTRVSVLHLAQYSGKCTRTVSQYTLTRVLLPQTGQLIQRGPFAASSIAENHLGCKTLAATALCQASGCIVAARSGVLSVKDG